MSAIKKIFLAAGILFFCLTVTAAPSPWDSWRSGYTNFEQGETLRERGNYVDAIKYFERARKNYQAVRSARPDWNQRVIADRLRDCDRQIAELKRLLGEGSKKDAATKKTVVSPDNKVTAVPEKRSDTVVSPRRPAVVPAVEDSEHRVSITVSELAKMRREINELRLGNQRLENSLQRQRNFEAEISALLRDRKLANDRYALLEKRYQALVAELKKPEERLTLLEQRLISERMNVERLDKQLLALQQQLKIEKENARLSSVAKTALENLLQQRNEEIAALSKKYSVISEKYSEIAKVQEQFIQLQRLYEAANANLAELNRLISSYKADNERLKEQNLTAENRIALLNAEIVVLKSKTEKTAEIETQSALSAEELAAAKAAVLAAQQRLENSEKRNQELRVQLADAENRYAQLQRERNEVLLKADTLTRELKSVIENLTAIQKKYAQLEETHRAVQLSLEQEKNSSKINAAELSGLRERNRELEEDVKKLHDRAGELEKRLATRNSDDFRAAASAKESVKKLEGDLQIAQNEISVLRTSLENAQKMLAESERKLRALGDEHLKVRSEVVAAAENEKRLQQDINELQQFRSKYEQLLKNFNALAAENRENRSLLEAAKPQKAELERARVRLLEINQLRQELAKEQRLNAELKSVYQQNQGELADLRKKSAEFETSRRKLIELEAKVKEAEHLKDVEKELAGLREREVELAALKVRFSDLETKLRNAEADLSTAQKEKIQKDKELAVLRRVQGEVDKLRRTNRELEAMIASQNSELEKLNTQLTAMKNESAKDMHVACRVEADKLRTAAAAAAELNDRINQLQNQLQISAASANLLREQYQELARDLDLRKNEIERLKKLNAELAELRAKSAAELLDKVDASRLERLEDELAAVNKLNAELAAERDRLNAVVNNQTAAAERSSKKTYVRRSVRSPEELAGMGVVAEKEGKIEVAIWNYQQALAAKDDFTLAHLRLGMILYQRGNYQDAVGHLTAALKVHPENLQLAVNTVRCSIFNKRFGNAKMIIDPLLKSHPRDHRVLLCAALIDEGLGQSSEAEKKLKIAESAAPDSAEIQLALAKLLASAISAERRGEAVIYYERAKAMGNAPDPELEKMLGYELDQRKEQLTFLRTAAREAEIHGDWKSAIWYYQKITKEKHHQYLPYLAFARWKDGNSARALEELEKLGGIENEAERNALRPVFMTVRALINLSEKNENDALTAVYGMGGKAVIPAEWVGMNLELEKLRKQKKSGKAAALLLKSISASESVKKP